MNAYFLMTERKCVDLGGLRSGTVLRQFGECKAGMRIDFMKKNLFLIKWEK